jgi:hypothetical protein
MVMDARPPPKAATGIVNVFVRRGGRKPR